MHIKHDELIEELEFKEGENFELRRRIEELESKLEDVEEKWQGKGRGRRGECVLTEGQEEWIQKVTVLEREIESGRKQMEESELRNKDLMDQLVNFEEDKQQFILKIKELEEDNIRLMKWVASRRPSNPKRQPRNHLDNKK